MTDRVFEKVDPDEVIAWGIGSYGISLGITAVFHAEDEDECLADVQQKVADELVSRLNANLLLPMLDVERFHIHDDLLESLIQHAKVLHYERSVFAASAN